MTITQINHFLAVAETLSFTQAANMLYVSQPAISKSISKLEDDMGFALFERSDNTLFLTNAGKLLYEFFTKSTAEYSSIIDDIRASFSNTTHTVRIGCPDTWAPSFFYDKISDYFSQKHPNTKIIIECFKLSELLSRLQSGKLDIVMTHDFFIPSIPNISAKNLTHTTFGILYSKDHFSNVTSIEDFKNTPFVLFDADIEKRFSDVLRNICSNYNFTPKVTNCGHLPTALFNTACGSGVMLFSTWDSAPLSPLYSFFPLDHSMNIKIIHLTDNPNSAVNNFVEDIIGLFDNNQ